MNVEKSGKAHLISVSKAMVGHDVVAFVGKSLLAAVGAWKAGVAQHNLVGVVRMLRQDRDVEEVNLTKVRIGKIFSISQIGLGFS